MRSPTRIERPPLPAPQRDRATLDGFCICESVIGTAEIALCIAAIESHAGPSRADYNRRNLLSIPTIRALAASAPLRALVDPILGCDAFPVRGILFDKLLAANWSVGWHQDCAIAVKQRIECEGFGPWSVKAGVVHVEPPVAVLENMVTLRVHLDDCGETNGPLRVIPGSHAHGKLREPDVKRWAAEREAVTCRVAAGGVVVMRPLVLHASSKAADGSRRRRVIHIEYAAGELPGGLRWHERGG